VSLAILAATAALQLAIVVVSGSVALAADTIHNFADAMTAIPLWVAFRLSRRAPTKRYSYGFHRAEDVAGIFVVVVILGSAGVAAFEAIRRLAHPEPIQNLVWVGAAGVIGFLGNEFVAVYRTRVGGQIGSAALVADGQHARADGLTSLGVLLSAIGVGLGFDRADPVVGLLITAAILVVLRNAARSVLHRVMDGTDEATIRLIEEAASSVDGVAHVTAARARWAGHELRAELDIQVDPALTVERGHWIAEEVEHELLHALPRLGMVTVHVDPHGHAPDVGPAAHHRRN
jgi:cation diffusion facilitator family transporter